MATVEVEAGAATREPPWIWLLVVGMPLLAATDLPAFTGSVRLGLTWHPVLTVVAAAPFALLVVTPLLVVWPAPRAWWVERRLRRTPFAAPAELAEMTEFAGGVRVVGTAAGIGGNARIYAAGWRRPRIAVTADFVRRWRHDRAAAELTLRHELAHIRAGEHLVIGLGGPFALFTYAWVPLCLLVGGLPVLIEVRWSADLIAFARDVLTPVLRLVPGLFAAPVAALWAAELAADRAGAPKNASGRGRVRSLADLLTHPPDRLRGSVAAGDRAFFRTACFPLAFLADLVPLAAATLVLFLVNGRLWPGARHAYAPVLSLALTNGARLAAISAVLLLIWPLVAPAWNRLWTGAPAARAERPPLVPVAVLLATAGTAVAVARPAPLWDYDDLYVPRPEAPIVFAGTGPASPGARTLTVTGGNLPSIRTSRWTVGDDGSVIVHVDEPGRAVTDLTGHWLPAGPGARAVTAERTVLGRPRLRVTGRLTTTAIPTFTGTWTSGTSVTPVTLRMTWTGGR